jgi:starch phosphorylase
MAFVTSKDFKEAFIERLGSTFGKSLSQTTSYDRYVALASIVRDVVLKNWITSRQKISEQSTRQVYYFSMEFLPGRFLISNLLHLGLKEMATEALDELGINLEILANEEAEPAIGTGGLGRLGACFLDSMASLGIPGHGCSIRYQYGLFKQRCPTTGLSPQTFGKSGNQNGQYMYVLAAPYGLIMFTDGWFSSMRAAKWSGLYPMMYL